MSNRFNSFWANYSFISCPFNIIKQFIVKIKFVLALRLYCINLLRHGEVIQCELLVHAVWDVLVLSFILGIIERLWLNFEILQSALNTIRNYVIFYLILKIIKCSNFMRNDGNCVSAPLLKASFFCLNVHITRSSGKFAKSLSFGETSVNDFWINTVYIVKCELHHQYRQSISL